MRLFKYDGYEHYRESQIQKNKKKLKLGCSWIVKEEVEFLSNYIREKIPDVERGLCHGIRNGNEIKWFKECLGVDVIGTDISPTVEDFGGIVWDFHNTNPEWTNLFDFVYSNSLDHACDPEKAVRAWVDSISYRGVVIIQWTANGSVLKCNEFDCFSASFEEYEQLFKKCGKLLNILKSDIRVWGQLAHWFVLGKRVKIYG